MLSAPGAVEEEEARMWNSCVLGRNLTWPNTKWSPRKETKCFWADTRIFERKRSPCPSVPVCHTSCETPEKMTLPLSSPSKTLTSMPGNGAAPARDHEPRMLDGNAHEHATLSMTNSKSRPPSYFVEQGAKVMLFQLSRHFGEGGGAIEVAVNGLSPRDATVLRCTNPETPSSEMLKPLTRTSGISNDTVTLGSVGNDDNRNCPRSHVNRLDTGPLNPCTVHDTFPTASPSAASSPSTTSVRVVVADPAETILRET
mmetsp:Transcript_13702/g.31623  ORF Transcript_13702/g.31623 Transcript_13702/m.31623 type:complete len:256 (-) Transcript_13702:1012-1779(-)